MSEQIVPEGAGEALPPRVVAQLQLDQMMVEWQAECAKRGIPYVSADEVNTSTLAPADAQYVARFVERWDAAQAIVDGEPPPEEPEWLPELIDGLRAELHEWSASTFADFLAGNPEWAAAFEAENGHDNGLRGFRAMPVSSGCGDECMRVMQLADRLLAACGDTRDRMANVRAAVAHQCVVFYYG